MLRRARYGRIGKGLLAALLALWPAAATHAMPPHVDSATEALAEDGAVYAARYGVSLAEAVRRLVAQQASVPAIDRLRDVYRERLAGVVLEHAPAFRFVLLLAGDAPVADTTIDAGGVAVPIVFRTGATATRETILAAIAAHQAELAAAFADPPGIGLDERAGALALLVRGPEAHGDEADATAARLSALAGVPVELRAWSAAEADLQAVDGGSRVSGPDPALGRRAVCTSGFAVTDGLRTGIATAAHCPDDLRLDAPDGTRTPLTLVGAWGARYQDVQIHVADTPFAPLFYADTARTRARALTSWRNRASTRVGDFVCHRGERTGYSCAEVAFVDFAPPGTLCAGPCPATWVAVAGPDCRSGDSGGPVFSGTIAFGLVKGASYTADGACRLYYYMSTDYLPPGWTLLRAGGPQSP